MVFFDHTFSCYKCNWPVSSFDLNDPNFVKKEFIKCDCGKIKHTKTVFFNHFRKGLIKSGLCRECRNKEV